MLVDLLKQTLWNLGRHTIVTCTILSVWLATGLWTNLTAVPPVR